MAAAIGNQYAAKDKRWGRAIDKALENRCRSDGTKALIALATKLLDAAENGESWALKELGDRLDGKPAQALIHQGDEDKPVVTKRVKFVSPATD